MGNRSHINYKFFWRTELFSESFPEPLKWHFLLLEVYCAKILAPDPCEGDMQGLKSTLQGAETGRNNWTRHSHFMEKEKETQKMYRGSHC